MADLEINKIKVSDLPEEKNPQGFWIFGYKVKSGVSTSVKVLWDKLLTVVEDAAKAIQLERRIAVAFERQEQLIPIAEVMTITKIVARNITKLEYRINTSTSEWKELTLNADINEPLTGQHDIILRINSDQKEVTFGDYNKYSTLTIFATAENKK